MVMRSLSYSKERVAKFTSVIGENLPSLQVLEAVEKVVDNLCDIQKDYEELAYLIHGLEVSGNVMLDPEGESAARFEKAENELKQFIEHLEICHQSAKNDPELIGYHEDSVVVEFEKAIIGTEFLIGVMQDKRWELMEHDANFDEYNGAFESAEKLIAELNR